MDNKRYIKFLELMKREISEINNPMDCLGLCSIADLVSEKYSLWRYEDTIMSLLKAATVSAYPTKVLPVYGYWWIAPEDTTSIEEFYQERLKIIDIVIDKLRQDILLSPILKIEILGRVLSGIHTRTSQNVMSGICWLIVPSTANNLINIADNQTVMKIASEIKEELAAYRTEPGSYFWIAPRDATTVEEFYAPRIEAIKKVIDKLKNKLNEELH